MVLFYPLVTTTKQSIVLGGVPATNAFGSRLQLTEWFEGDAKAFSSHGRSTRLKILIPAIKNKQEFHSLMLYIPILCYCDPHKLLTIFT